MKNLYFIFCFFALCMMTSCEEVPPDVSRMGGGNTGGQNDDLADQPRQVIIEEFTGVACIQCPAGSEAIEDLLDIHGTNLVAVSIHSSFNFSVPHPESLYDFRTDDGDNLLNHIGSPIGFPTASVNRKLFEGENDLQAGRADWPGFIAVELAEEPRVKIGVETIYDDNRSLDINVTLLLADNILAEEDPRITIMITENNVVDHQLTPESSPDTQADYKHKHVLRDIVTNFDGDPITESLTAGSLVELDFSYNLSADWVAEECEVVVLVHGNGEVKDVFQAHQVHVIDQ